MIMMVIIMVMAIIIVMVIIMVMIIEPSSHQTSSTCWTTCSAEIFPSVESPTSTKQQQP